ncbi:MAG: hypothetical protein U0R70_15145 [Solirubrobacteraceae bacterium]
MENDSNLRTVHDEVVIALHELAAAIRSAEQRYAALANGRRDDAGRFDAVCAQLRGNGYLARQSAQP